MIYIMNTLPFIGMILAVPVDAELFNVPNHNLVKIQYKYFFLQLTTFRVSDLDLDVGFVFEIRITYLKVVSTYLWGCCFQNKILFIFGEISIHSMVKLFVEQIHPTFIGHSKALK